MITSEQLAAAIALPLPIFDIPFAYACFNPWSDIIKGIAGHYSTESDTVMIEVLEAVRDRRTYELIEDKGFAAEFLLYVLAGHGLIDYGSSPRGGHPEIRADRTAD